MSKETMLTVVLISLLLATSFGLVYGLDMPSIPGMGAEGPMSQAAEAMKDELNIAADKMNMGDMDKAKEMFTKPLDSMNTGDMKDKADDMATKASDAMGFDAMKNEAKDMSEKASEAMSKAMSMGSDTAKDVAESTSDSVAPSTNEVEDKAEGAMDVAKLTGMSWADWAKDTMGSFMGKVPEEPVDPSGNR